MGNVFICNQLVIFVVACCVAIKSSSTYEGSIILDVSEILKDPKSSEADIKSSVQWFVQYHSGNENKSHVHLYYEYDFYDGLWKLQTALKLLERTKLHMKLLINIKDPANTKYIPSSTDYVQDKYAALMNIIVGYSSIARISIEFTNMNDEACNFYSIQNRFDNTKSSIVREVKDLILSLTTRTLEVGYIVNFEHLNCPGHIHSIENSDYLVISIPLTPNYDIKSYSTFTENMEDIMKNVSNHLQNSFELPFIKHIFYKFNAREDFNLGNIEMKKCTKGYLTFEAKEIVKMAKNISEKLYVKQHEAILVQFLSQLVGENPDFNLITKYTPDHAKIVMDTEQFNRDLVIPQLTKLPVKRLDKIGIQSIKFLMEEIASSGFNTIMINGETWQALTSQKIPETTCNSISCWPQNVLYLNDMHYPFSTYNYSSILTLLEAGGGGMQLTGLVFSAYYNDSKVLSWDNALTRLKDAVKLSRGKSAVIETGCTEQTDIFGPLLNLDTSDIICDALELQKVFGCHSLGTTSSIIVWRGVLRIKVYETNNFVENTIKKLDALILGRQMLRNQYADQKQVILRIKVEYAKEGNQVIRHPVYCTSLGIKVYKLYELILTWAQIYEFPLILEPINSVTGYNNPITWQQLKMLTNGQMHNLMETFPVFIRRSYNQSRVFGTWTKGMYPCINLSKNHQSIKELEFHNKFLGVKVRLDLHLDNSLLRIDELQTVLLLALGKFLNIEVMLRSESEFQLLSDTILRDDFRENLKVNNISQRNIYLDVSKQLTDNKTDVIIKLVDNLKSYNFQVHIHILNTNQSDTFLNLSKVSIGLVLENCTNVAQKLVSNPDNYNDMNNLEYLICETDVILAKNSDLTAMQDYLETHLYLKKFFQYFYPNLKEIHFRLHSNLAGDTFEDQSENLFLFLSDISKYANSYSIHYFILDAFPIEMDIYEASFWKSTNYQNLTDIHSIVEPLAAFLNISSWKPEKVRWVAENYLSTTTMLSMTEDTTKYLPSIEVSSTPTFTTETNPTLSSTPEASSPFPVTIKSPTTHSYTTGYNFYSTHAGMIVTMLPYQQTTAHNHNSQLPKSWMESTSFQYILICALLLACLVLLYAVKTMQNRRYLTTKEVNDFLHGRRETLEEAAVRRNRHTINNFNVFDGLVYQKEFEISTRNVKIKRINSSLIYTGMFSKVYRGKMEGCKNNISVDICNRRTTKSYFMAMLSEVKMLCYIGNHDNITRFVGSYTKKIRKGILWIVTESSPEDSLNYYLKMFKEDTSFQEMVRFAREIATGMEYLSKQSVIHGDLRSKNVFLSQMNKTCKIGNFGLPRKLLEYQKIIQQDNLHLLPWRWMAFESLKKLEFSIQSDVWSYGVTIWEIFTMGNIPYEDDVTFTVNTLTPFMDELCEGRHLGCPSRATAEIFKIMTNCWTLEPQYRPGFEKLVKLFSELPHFVEISV